MEGSAGGVRINYKTIAGSIITGSAEISAFMNKQKMVEQNTSNMNN